MTDEPQTSNTGEKQGNNGRFVKGDKRINRNGRPKSFDQLRKLAQRISHEPIKDDSQITVAEAILRTMAKENPARFVEIAFGKVPDEVKVSGSLTVKKAYVTISPDEWDQADSDVQPAAVADQAVARQVASPATDG